MLLSMSNHYQTCAARRQNGAGWTLTDDKAIAGAQIRETGFEAGAVVAGAAALVGMKMALRPPRSGRRVAGQLILS